MIPSPFVRGSVPRRSVAGAGFVREILLEQALFALVLVGVVRCLVVLTGHVGPLRGESVVEFEPFFKPAFGIGQERLGGAFGLAHAAIDAIAGIDRKSKRLNSSH